MPGFDVHLVGSAPLASAAEMFETVSRWLAPHLPRLPDGETGRRANWINAIEPVFAEHPDFERTDDLFKRANSDTAGWFRYRVKPGIDPRAVGFERLFDAAAAIESYALFKRLKEQGTIAARTRFQVALAPSVAVIRRYVVEEQQAALEPAYEAAQFAEIAKMARAIPPQELAVQWDLASAIFERLERGLPTRYGKDRAEMMESFARYAIRLGEQVPEGVELLFHLCYGDNKHKHSIEPASTAIPVAFANRVLAGIGRPVQLFHLPVPRERDDEAYFAPLRDFEGGPETRLSLGLVHHTDGVVGTLRRIAVAKRYLPDFLIATECGFGRRAPETLPELLRIHAEVAGHDA